MPPRRSSAQTKLRGSLHRFNAVRGTIITSGSFSSGTKQAAFERGAAPITLIDGEKLLDLLRQHEIGVSKQAIEYFEFDPTRLAQFEVREADVLPDALTTGLMGMGSDIPREGFDSTAFQAKIQYYRPQFVAFTDTAGERVVSALPRIPDLRSSCP